MGHSITLSFRMSVLTILTMLTGLAVGLVITLQYHFNKEMAYDSASDSFHSSSSKIHDHFVSLKQHSHYSVKVLSLFDELSTPPGVDEMPRLESLATIAAENMDLYALYIGYDNGDFYELVNLDNDKNIRTVYKAIPEDRWIVIKIQGKGQERLRYIYYLDDNLVVRTFKKEASSYDVRVRPWFKQAVVSDGIIETEPYLFSNLGAPGITFASAQNGGQSVIAADISLSGLNSYLGRQQLLPQSQIMLFDDEGMIIAQAGNGLDVSDANRGGAPDELVSLVTSADSKSVPGLITIRGNEFFGYVEPLEEGKLSAGMLGFLVSQNALIKPYMSRIHFSLLMTLVLVIVLAPFVFYFTSLLVSPINALVVESNKVGNRRYDDVKEVRSRITELNTLSDSMFSMAGSIQAFEQSQRDLIDSFIKLMATAIDKKSPYTAGHCARVPEIALMLAKQACDSDSGSLKRFSFTTDEEWREFRIAAWLHDCGKVSTPEHIVDKATKLETIYNRIHEIRTRFEVLLRDAEIDYWRAVSEGGDQKYLKKTLDEKHREIKDDFSFIAECNVGGEFMADEKIERVKSISQKTWTRNLDDRLGLGHLELKRFPEEEVTLPCLETLLSDRAEHLIERIDCKSLGDAESFNMEIPEHLYNLGEIHNLSIKKGTLTAEDRYKINEHIITTILMLEKLPLPDGMKRVPEYAGSHHETLIGTGYPRKCVSEDISIPARIMAISDVFEALTACDRPYKKAKKLSEAIRILSFMVKDEHLDAELFVLFLKSGVYIDYAKKYLDSSQIDDVDINSYIQQFSTDTEKGTGIVTIPDEEENVVDLPEVPCCG